MRSIAIIPARAGSRRLPGKNVKLFEGVPIIAYAIRAALDGDFDVVMTSTDSSEIAEIARQHGAQVPFMRDARTAGDHATTVEVLLEVLADYAARGDRFEIGCCLYPCNPFVTSEKLAQARRALDADRLDSVISAVRYAHPVQRSFGIENGRVRLLFPDHRDTRTQDLPATFHDAAQFYFFRVAALQTQRALWTPNTGCIELPESEVQDIDTAEDWALAELKYQRWKARA